MHKASRTRTVSASQARHYLEKAEEFHAAASDELAAERFVAATSLAIHAAIDALWPLLGGGPHRPHDHRIRDLRVIRTTGPSNSVALWPLSDS